MIFLIVGEDSEAAFGSTGCFADCATFLYVIMSYWFSAAIPVIFHVMQRNRSSRSSL